MAVQMWRIKVRQLMTGSAGKSPAQAQRAKADEGRKRKSSRFRVVPVAS